MIENAKNPIKKGAPKRDPACYEVLENIVIPKGTMLRSAGDGKFSAPVGLDGVFSISTTPGNIYPGFRRVISA